MTQGLPDEAADEGVEEVADEESEGDGEQQAYLSHGHPRVA